MTTKDHWYKHPWAWFVIMVPFSAVLFGIVMLVAAGSHPNDVVVDDYYKEGMAINQRLKMERTAERRNISATSALLSSSRIEFRIDNIDESAVVMRLFHVTDKALDRRLLLVQEGARTYAVSTDRALPFAREGVWYVELEGVSGSWRLRKRIVTPIDRLELSAG